MSFLLENTYSYTQLKSHPFWRNLGGSGQTLILILEEMFISLHVVVSQQHSEKKVTAFLNSLLIIPFSFYLR